MTHGPSIFSQYFALEKTIFANYMTQGTAILSLSLILGPKNLLAPILPISSKNTYNGFANPNTKGRKLHIGWGKDDPLITQCSLVLNPPPD